MKTKTSMNQKHREKDVQSSGIFLNGRNQSQESKPNNEWRVT